jgi:hypothetical protein
MNQLRSEKTTSELKKKYTPEILWKNYGIVHNVTVRLPAGIFHMMYYSINWIKPFTAIFPRADIHEIMTPDLLHQVIKGAFKDHLVAWVETYFKVTWGNTKAKKLMDELDRR